MARRLRVGLVGTGSIARAHLPAYLEFQEELELVAVCDPREEAARQFAQSAGVTQVYSSLEAMLAESGVDAVDVCTIHDQHAEHAIMAANAGKHVLIEKPMAISVDEGRRMVAAAEAAGVALMVAQVFRYLPQSHAIRRLIQEGELGDVWAVRSDDLHSSMPPASAVEEATKPDQPRLWYHDGVRAGGGALVTFTTHHLDLFRFYLGDIKRVTGKCWTDHPMFFNGAEDRCWASLEFKSGAVGNVYASFTTRSPWLHRYWLYGERGTICTNPDPNTHAGIQHHAPAEISSERFGGESQPMMAPRFLPVEGNCELRTDRGFVNEILHFAECCRTGEEPLSSGRDNLGTIKALFGIYESARRGGTPVDLDTL